MLTNIFNTSQEDARKAHALEMAKVPAGRMPIYLAAQSGEGMKQGIRTMFGMPDPEDESKQLLKSILAKHTNLQTRSDYMNAVKDLVDAGFVEYAQEVMAIAKNIPDVIEPKTYQDNFGATRYLNSGTTWKEGDLVPGETAEEPSKTTDKTYATGEALALAILQEDPAFQALVKSNKQIEINELIKKTISQFQETKTFTQNGIVYDLNTKEPLIAGSTPTIKTFVQGGVVYDANTLQPILKGSEEDRPTFVQDGITYYKDTQLPVLADSEKKREKLLQGGIWRYVDNSAKVFPDVTLDKDVNQKAADLYNTWYAVAGNDVRFNTNEGKVELATQLIQNNLANSQLFSDTVKSLDKDSANAIAQENLVVKAVERLSENYVKSEVGKMDTILRPIEQQINQFMPHLRDNNGDFIYDRAGNALRDTSKGIPGWDFFSRYERYVGDSETVRQAKNFAEDAQLLINTVIKQRSGSAVSVQEAERLIKEYETGFPNSSSFANWVSSIRKLVEETRSEVVSGFMPEVQYRYFSQMGIYPTLYDPDEQLKALPMGAKWRDESGELFTKKR